MGRLFEFLIWSLLFLSTKGQALYDDMGERKRSVNLALLSMRTDLQQFSQGIERMVVKKLEGIENIIQAKMDQIGTKDNKSISTIQTEHRLLRQEMRVLRYLKNIQSIEQHCWFRLC